MVTGIDCSKDYFDIAVLEDHKVVFTGRFTNDKKGFKALLPHVRGSHVAMEATGPYYFQLALFLYESGEKVSVLNPLTVRRFSQMQLSRAKTDKKDAAVIAKFAATITSKLWSPPAKEVLVVRNLEGYLDSLKKRKGILSNQLHALKASGTLDEELRRSIDKELSDYDANIKSIAKKIETLINKHYQELAKTLRSIPGIGPRSTALLIILTGGFELFENYKQVISYFGLAPRVFESGSSVKGKGHICKMGMGQIRKVLYMAAVSAIKVNKACKELYERLIAKGKSHNVAIIAAVNKLIKQAFAIAKSGKAYYVKSA